MPTTDRPLSVPTYGEGAAVRLRGWRAPDLADLREWMRPHHEWHRWDGPYFPVPDDAQADAFVARLATASAAEARDPLGSAVDGLPPRRVVVADYLFSATDWVRLDYATWSGNAPMLGVGRALGFTEEGRFRQARVVDGVRHDSVVMGVLRDEWERAAAQDPSR
ncbi:GNAT family N-acetyltransferase [Cellulosimicrobium terreum]|nr:GNAT family N-acetyltransferase [Cellulosimicrobium terreum]